MGILSAVAGHLCTFYAIGSLLRSRFAVFFGLQLITERCVRSVKGDFHGASHEIATPNNYLLAVPQFRAIISFDIYDTTSQVIFLQLR